MSSKSLSAVLEKRIQRLCLSDFPCGSGSWRETKDGPERAETESRDALLDLLDCPRSPWWLDDYSWSPQAKELRRLAVIHPERLTAKFIYSFFTSFCIVNKNVSVIDGGLLKFRKLEKLDLSCNVISEIPAESLPSTLKILELRANCLSSLCSLTERPPPQLQYLGLSSNRLGSHKDISCLTGRYWPQLVTLELNDCEFEDQQALLNALSSLPSLKMLMLKGNPFTLAPSYPGLAVDCLPQLACLDTLWLFPKERSRFRGLASVRDVTMDVASVTVSLGRLRGIPDVLTSEMKTTSPVAPVSYKYFITYQFLCSSASDKTKLNSESQPDTTSTAHVPEADADQQQTNQEQSKPDTGAFTLHDETYTGFQHLSQHSTARMMWSKEMDFNDKQTYTVSSLGQLKKFLNEGLDLRLEEEKVLSCPAAFKKEGKPSRPEKEKKTKEEIPAKSTSTKDKISKSAPELVQDPPISAILGSAHVPLHSMVQGSQKVNVLCDFGLLQKDLGMEIMEKKKEDEESKQTGGSGAKKSTATSKGKGNEDADVQSEPSTPARQEPVTVELCVELKRWQTASDMLQPSLQLTATPKFKKKVLKLVKRQTETK
ncbi:leucine-rich repeat-containing protein 43 isoform X1 [Nothobranchius furzeri]|uniref:Leucine rich repeat containing 43 n=2 Tax=Nothobranchius furzeri TaxID=105023 RepID=A0A9D2XDU4_NOTFU|nr:leucine rich repeat containing 43 [Nothobranchius furzeri]